jgi:hypothetical protein
MCGYPHPLRALGFLCVNDFRALPKNLNTENTQKGGEDQSVRFIYEFAPSTRPSAFRFRSSRQPQPEPCPYGSKMRRQWVLC